MSVEIPGMRSMLAAGMFVQVEALLLVSMMMTTMTMLAVIMMVVE